MEYKHASDQLFAPAKGYAELSPARATHQAVALIPQADTDNQREIPEPLLLENKSIHKAPRLYRLIVNFISEYTGIISGYGLKQIINHDLLLYEQGHKLETLMMFEMCCSSVIENRLIENDDRIKIPV